MANKNVKNVKYTYTLLICWTEDFFKQIWNICQFTTCVPCFAV